MKIIQIVGARPQFVKLAPLSRAIRAAGHTELIIHSGQHYDPQMNSVFFSDMDIPAPDFNLNVGSGTQATQTAEILALVEPILIAEKPDWVIVFGDTNTTLAGALAASKLQIKIAHVEAGLRSYNRSMPEEINRIVTDHISDILLAPTVQAIKNSKNEGLLAKTHLVGDIMVDSLQYGLKKAHAQSTILDTLKPKEFLLLTLHRPYNVDDPAKLQHILKGLNSLGQKIFFPVHPRTRNIIQAMPEMQYQNIQYIDPLSYLDFLMMLDSCQMILSDSGGIQKEAYILKKPCVTLRSETEWVETVKSGWNLLLSPENNEFPAKILNFEMPSEHPEIFGSDVARKMVSVLGM